MLALFNRPVGWVPQSHETSTVQMRRLLPIIHQNIENVMLHYRNRDYVVLADHMCHVLLRLTHSTLDYDPWQYLSSIVDRANTIAIQRGIYTATQRGRRFRAKMYPHAECHELWVHLDDKDYGNTPPSEWSTARSLVCLDHGYSDLTYDIPNGRTVRYGDRDTVWGIDIVGMCLRYYEWANERRLRGLSISMTGFIHSEILPSALPSIIDLALINRYWCVAYGLPMTRSSSVLPMYIVEPSRLDHYLAQQYKTNRDRPMRYPDLLRTIPVASSPSGWDALWLPDVLVTDPILAVWYYARLTHIERIVHQSVRVNRANRDYIGQLVRLNQRLLTGSTMERMMPDVMLDIRHRIQRLQIEAKSLFEVTS